MAAEWSARWEEFVIKTVVGGVEDDLLEEYMAQSKKQEANDKSPSRVKNKKKKKKPKHQSRSPSKERADSVDKSKRAHKKRSRKKSSSEKRSRSDSSDDSSTGRIHKKNRPYSPRGKDVDRSLSPR